MPIWKLAPITTSADDRTWGYTGWFGPILVRARNPGQARKIAAEAFRKAGWSQTDTDESLAMSPWLNDDVVECRRVPVSTFRPDGPDQILDPRLSDIGTPNARH